jgi:hypothetical protein
MNGGKDGPLFHAQGLWDTGATNSAISANLAQAMGLQPVDKAQTLGVHGPEIVNVYLVDILIPGTTVCFQRWTVSEAKLPVHGLLIGMDIIGLGDFSITHDLTNTIFSFRIPTLQQPVDYVAEIQEHNRQLQRSVVNEQARADRRAFLKKNRKKKPR